jgi:hypothetical protein
VKFLSSYREFPFWNASAIISFPLAGARLGDGDPATFQRSGQISGFDPFHLLQKIFFSRPHPVPAASLIGKSRLNRNPFSQHGQHNPAL